MLDSGAVPTAQLLKAFGWTSNEQNDQHDIQEAMRIIMDFLHQVLAGTEHDPTAIFRGELSSYIQCEFCATERQTPERFYDLLLQVKHQPDVPTSLLSLLEPERLDHDNSVFCDPCGQKQSSLKGQKLTSLPPLLVLSLKRF